MQYNIYLIFIIFLSCIDSTHSLEGETFEDDVIHDERVWIVEFYSHFCKSCNDFSPKWREIEVFYMYIATGRVCIDDKPGMDIAEKLGVLEKVILGLQADLP